jgi:hypothetical protein
MDAGGLWPTLPRMSMANLAGAVIDLNGAPRYLHHGWFLISYANLVVILVMIAVFALAIWLPFPHADEEEE